MEALFESAQYNGYLAHRMADLVVSLTGTNADRLEWRRGICIEQNCLGGAAVQPHLTYLRDGNAVEGEQALLDGLTNSLFSSTVAVQTTSRTEPCVHGEGRFHKVEVLRFDKVELALKCSIGAMIILFSSYVLATMWAGSPQPTTHLILKRVIHRY